MWAMTHKFTLRIRKLDHQNLIIHNIKKIKYKTFAKKVTQAVNLRKTIGIKKVLGSYFKVTLGSRGRG